MAKPGFDSLALSAVAHDLQTLAGGRIQGIRQPHEHTVVFEAYKAGRGEVRWLFDCSAQWARTHLTALRPPNPPTPPAFCQALRKFIDGGQILSIAQRGFDRILDIEIRGYEGHDYLLSAEFMGRHSNMILLGPEEDGARHILHAAKLIPARLSRVREVLPGRVYIPPPSSDKPDPRKANSDVLRDAPPEKIGKWLRENFEGISPFLADELALRSRTSDVQTAFDEVFHSGFTPVSLRDENDHPAGAYPIAVESWPHEQPSRDSLHKALDEYFGFTIPRAQIENEKRTLAGALDKAWQQRAQSLAQVEHGQSEGSRAAQFRRWGDLILGNLWQLGSGQGSALMLDYFQDPPVEIAIPLDADLTPQENAKRFFDRARQGEKGAARLVELHTKLEHEVAEIERAQSQLSAADSLEALATLRETMQANGWLHAAPSNSKSVSARPDFGGKRIRAFTSPEGWQVFVGENAEANDYLVQRLSQSNDWWLHVRAGTSAHAILRTQNAPQKVPHSALQFAARLVAARSPSKHAAVVAVDYTLRKYVRRPRRAAPGSVLYTHEKTLHVSPKDED